MIKQIVFFVVVFFAVSCESYGQTLSIELSIEWKNEKSDTCSMFNPISIPFLEIRYRNLTGDSIYLPKIYENRNSVPLFPAGPLMGRYKPYKIEETMLSYSNEKNSVLIGGMPIPNNKLWIVLPDSVISSEDEEYEVGEINQVLSDVYETILHIKENNATRYNQISDIDESKIGGVLKDEFVFLLPYSEYVEYYNLSGFMIIGGTYSYSVFDNEICDFLFTSSIWNNEEEKWEFKKVRLPEIVGGYHLYSGGFYTNEIRIAF